MAAAPSDKEVASQQERRDNNNNTNNSGGVLINTGPGEQVQQLLDENALMLQAAQHLQSAGHMHESGQVIIAVYNRLCEHLRTNPSPPTPKVPESG